MNPSVIKSTLPMRDLGSAEGLPDGLTAALALPRVASLLFDSPLLLEPSKAREIAEALGPRLAAGLELPLPNARRVSNRFSADRDVAGGIALIEINGSLVNRTRGMEALSGLQSYETLRADLLDAATTQGVKGILLRIDSPGGEVAGAFDLADDIAQISDEIPVWAAVDDMAASGGYLLAAQAQRIFVTRSSYVGSVGVIVVHREMSELAKREGIAINVIRSGARKAETNPFEALSEKARAGLQADVERFHSIFVESVAGPRGLTQEAVNETESALLGGEEALRLGFADEQGTVRDALQRMQEEIGRGASGRSKRNGPRASAKADGDGGKQEETEMAETKGGPPPDLPVEKPADKQADTPQGGVDEAAVMRACNQYRVDHGLVEAILSAAASTEDGQGIAQVFAMANDQREAMAAEVRKAGKGSLTAQDLRSKLCDARATDSEAHDVSGAHAGDEGTQLESGAYRNAVLTACDKFNQGIDARRRMGGV